VSSLSAVVFDFDGVILDSETPEFESHRRVFERYGAALTIDEWCGQIGIYTEGHERRWFEQLCRRSDSAPSGQDVYDAERTNHFRNLLPTEPMSGIRELLETLDRAGVPMAVASTAPARWVVTSAELIGVTPFFRTIVTSDDVERRKPAPDVYLEAMRRLGADPRRAIAIEDSGPGIAAARAAGMTTIAIPHRLTEGHDLAAADLRVAHAGELTLARLETLVAGG